jgi:hypothetical protein
MLGASLLVVLPLKGDTDSITFKEHNHLTPFPKLWGLRIWDEPHASHERICAAVQRCQYAIFPKAYYIAGDLPGGVDCTGTCRDYAG